MIALVQIDKGEWSIASLDFEEGDHQWWCGDHEWVSPYSSYWQFMGSEYQTTFPSRAAAERFAKSKGWIL